MALFQPWIGKRVALQFATVALSFGLAIGVGLACGGDVGGNSVTGGDSDTATSDATTDSATAGPGGSTGSTSGPTASTDTTTDGGGMTTGGGPLTPPEGFFALGALNAVGLEWRPVSSATAYNLYFSESSGVTPATGTLISNVQRNHIHTGLQNSTTYYYVLTATDGTDESDPTAEIQATPNGPYGLRVFGNGDTDAIVADDIEWVPIENRLHVLLLGDGYLAGELGNYEEDVTDYIDEIFDVTLYPNFFESFVIWSMPQASAAHVGQGETAFDMTGSARAGPETPARIWAAIDGHPFPPAELIGNSVRNWVVGMMVAEPSDGHSGFSGYMTSVDHPNGGKSVRVGFAHTRVHEISHAIAYLSDEYYDTGHGSGSSQETSNTFEDPSCSAIPWQHLLHGSAINPDVDQLVGAFGADNRVHAELLCLMNGTHDNADLYGGNGRLRTTDRFCNWCRELTTYRIYQRTSIVEDFDTWKNEYRTPFFEIYGFQVPAIVPQENSNGESFFDACR